MKRGFTLVEMLIVTVVIAVLASVAFKLSAIGSDSEAKSRTVTRMQRLENAISGYYAAFGSYPPVKLHGSRNFYYEINAYGIQQTSREPGTELNKKQVLAACRAQPLAVSYPYPRSSGGVDLYEYVKEVSQQLTELHNDGEEGYENPNLSSLFDALENSGQLASKYGKSSWSETQLFQFGLMSYLLPRYLVMLGHEDHDVYEKFLQWSDNNQLPSQFEDGTPYASWTDMNSEMTQTSGGQANRDSWKVSALPSQSATARWMANLEGILNCEFPNRSTGGYWLYGIDVMNHENDATRNVDIHNAYPKIYSSGDSQSGTGGGGSQLYALAEITCRDGWGNEFFYYSPPPYQNYRLWSSGKNGMTFPPWISPEEMSSDGELSKNRKLIAEWISDDIVHLKN